MRNDKKNLPLTPASERNFGSLAVITSVLLTLSGCAVVPEQQMAPLVEGPPITNTVTPFDKALSCLDGRINKKITFSVGAIIDQTGKEQITEGGTGKFVTQGAGDIVQSALFKAGTTVVNRRDPRIMETEVRWGLRNNKSIYASNYFITGSINSLDFIPGGGFDAQIDGMGPRYRQHRLLVGLDLFLTDSKTGRIVATVPMQKQIVASEMGFGIGRFFGDTLVTLDFGGERREALQFAMRQMLNLATFDLLTQVMDPKNYGQCKTMVDKAHGLLDVGGRVVPVQDELDKAAQHEKPGNVGGSHSMPATTQREPMNTEESAEEIREEGDFATGIPESVKRNPAIIE